MRSFGFVVLGVALVSSVALAQADKDKGASPHGRPAAAAGTHDKDVRGDKEKGADANKGEGATARTGDDADDDDAIADGGKAVRGRRTPAQMVFRKDLWARREKAIEAKDRPTLRTVQGCLRSVDGAPAEVIQDSVSMLKIRLVEGREEYWILPDTVKPANRR